MASRRIALSQTFSRYLVAGGLAFLTHLAVLTLMVEAFAINETLSSAVGFLCAVPVNFLFQYRFVFRSSVRMSQAFARYSAITLATLCLNTLMFWALVTLLLVHYLPAQVFTTATVLFVNFFANRAFTFAHKPD